MQQPRVSAELNVTPLIDILLVLLVIFLAGLPLVQQGLDAEIPQQVQHTPAPLPTGQIVAEYGADRRLHINRQEVALADAGALFRDVFAGRRDRTLFLIGDGSLRYGEVARLIDIAAGAGVDRVGIITERMRRAGSDR